MELVFKRLKSPLQLGSIPTKTEEAGEVWINGKILLSLLTKKYLGDIDFSPSWNIRREPEHMKGDETCTFIIFMMILPNIQTVSFDILELVKMSFIEKRKTVRDNMETTKIAEFRGNFRKMINREPVGMEKQPVRTAP